MFARVVVNVPAVSGVFDYAIPPEFASQLQLGSLVTAPFGKQVVQGVVIELTESPAVANTRPILGLLDPAPVLTAPLIALAIQLAESTLNPLAAIVSLMLPAGLGQQADILYSLNEHRSRTAEAAARTWPKPRPFSQESVRSCANPPWKNGNRSGGLADFRGRSTT